MIGIKRASCVIIGVLTLTGCTLYQKPEVPEFRHPDVFKVSLKNTSPLLNDHWWENFKDPQLNELVEKSLKTNVSYQIAIKNIDIAQTYVDINMTALFPLMAADFATSRNKSIVNVGNGVASAPQLSGSGPGAPFNLSLLTATVSYQLDFWNQAHNAVDQAKANKFSVEANTNIAKLTLISAVTSTYFQIVALSQNIDNLKKQEKAAAEILALNRIQYDSGLVDESIVYQASTALETIKSTLNTTTKQKDILVYGMAYLLGEYPENFSLTPTGKLGALPLSTLIPEGIPSRVVGMRPDVQYALGQILAFGYLEKQNIANFLPSFSLSSTYGYASNILSQLVKSSNALWNYGLNATQILLDYPALLSQYKQSKMQYESAVLSYQNTVLNAFVEVDNALISYQEDMKVMQSFLTSQNNANELFGIAKAQYAAGLTDYVNYLSNNLLALQSAYNVTNQQLVVTQDIVQTYKTLGMGVQPSPNQTP